MGLVPLSEIYISTLPPELIIDDFIEGYEPVSYEDYLTEFINNSALFLSLSQNRSYSHTPKNQQNNGECDCCSSHYEFDFKLLGSQSGIYATRNLSFQKAYLAKGILATLIPRQIEGMEITQTGNLLRRYSLGELLNIDACEVPKFNRDRICPETDVKTILKIVKCKKNTLFYSTDFFYSDNNFFLEDIVETVQSYLNERFANLFRFRDRFVTDNDTFFAAIIQGYLCVALWQDDYIQFKDLISLSKSSVFSDLYETISTNYKAKLVMK